MLWNALNITFHISNGRIYTIKNIVWFNWAMMSWEYRKTKNENINTNVNFESINRWIIFYLLQNCNYNVHASIIDRKSIHFMDAFAFQFCFLF